jgi:hypothetical protein
MKHAPLRGLRCFPRESTGSMSGKCGWAFDMANLSGRSDLTRPVCADMALAASMRRTAPCCLTNQPYSTGIMASAPGAVHRCRPRAARQPEPVHLFGRGHGIHQPCPNLSD